MIYVDFYIYILTQKIDDIYLSHMNYRLAVIMRRFLYDLIIDLYEITPPMARA